MRAETPQDNTSDIILNQSIPKKEEMPKGRKREAAAGKSPNSSIKIFSDDFFEEGVIIIHNEFTQWPISQYATQGCSLLTYTFRGCQAGHCAFALMTVKTSSLCEKRQTRKWFGQFHNESNMIYSKNKQTYKKHIKSTKSNRASKFWLWEMCFVLFCYLGTSCPQLHKQPLWMQEAKAASKGSQTLVRVSFCSAGIELSLKNEQQCTDHVIFAPWADRKAFRVVQSDDRYK